jgi:hypothetical protein
MYCSNINNIELTLLTETVHDGHMFRLSSATIKSRQTQYIVVMVISVK